MHSVSGLQENYLHPVVVLPLAVWVWTCPRQKPVQIRSMCSCFSPRSGHSPAARELSRLRARINEHFGSLASMANITLSQYSQGGCGSGGRVGRPLTRRSAVWAQCPPFCVPQVSLCKILKHKLPLMALPTVCDWMNVCEWVNDRTEI